MKPNELLAARQERVQRRLGELLPNVPGLQEAMRYSVMAGGKRLRAVLTLSFCSVCGALEENALDLACAVELFHTYTLIHDDLPCMDDSDLRRGLPTAHIRYGEWMALLSGDALQGLAFRTLLRAPLRPELIIRSAELLGDTAGPEGVCYGQYLDLQGESQALNEAQILELNRHKTGDLICTACALGCLAADREDLVPEAVRYGRTMGTAFQLRDDLLDMESSPEALGKSTGTDAKNEKSTYAALLGVEACRTQIRILTEEAKSILNGAFEEPGFLLWLTEFLAGRQT